MYIEKKVFQSTFDEQMSCINYWRRVVNMERDNDYMPVMIYSQIAPHHEQSIIFLTILSYPNDI